MNGRPVEVLRSGQKTSIPWRDVHCGDIVWVRSLQNMALLVFSTDSKRLRFSFLPIHKPSPPDKSQYVQCGTGLSMLITKAIELIRLISGLWLCTCISNFWHPSKFGYLHKSFDQAKTQKVWLRNCVQPKMKSLGYKNLYLDAFKFKVWMEVQLAKPQPNLYFEVLKTFELRRWLSRKAGMTHLDQV